MKLIDEIGEMLGDVLIAIGAFCVGVAGVFIGILLGLIVALTAIRWGLF